MTNITDTHKEFFENMGEYNNLALFSCFVNGEPTAAISAVEYDQDSEEYIISPVAVFRDSSAGNVPLVSDHV